MENWEYKREKFLNSLTFDQMSMCRNCPQFDDCGYYNQVCQECPGPAEQEHGPCDSCGEAASRCVCGDYVDTAPLTPAELAEAKLISPEANREALADFWGR